MMTDEAAVLSTAISYAEDQAMAAGYFPEWQTCADLIRAMCEHRVIQLDAATRPGKLGVAR